MWPSGDDRGSIRLEQPLDPDQRALVDLAKDAKRRGGVSVEEGQTLADWAVEYGLPGHGPITHPIRGGWAGTNLYINIGPIKHIPVF